MSLLPPATDSSRSDPALLWNRIDGDDEATDEVAEPECLLPVDIPAIASGTHEKSTTVGGGGAGEELVDGPAAYPVPAEDELMLLAAVEGLLLLYNDE